jgi:hypothetical protein
MSASTLHAFRAIRSYAMRANRDPASFAAIRAAVGAPAFHIAVVISF